MPSICLVCPCAAVELMDHSRNIGLGLVVRRDAMILVNSGRASVVGRQRQRQIVVISGKQRVQIGCSGAHILVGLVAVCNAEVAAGCRHQLHEPTGSGPAFSAGISATLGLHNAGQQVHIKIVLMARPG